MGVVTPAMSTNVSPRPRQRRRGAASIVTLFAALLLAGCASSNLAGDSAGEVPAVAEPADAAPEALPADTDGLLVLPDQRMVVHSASMSLLVEDVDEAAAEVKEWVRQAGGYVASETANAASGRNRWSLGAGRLLGGANAFAALGPSRVWAERHGRLKRSLTSTSGLPRKSPARLQAAGRGGHDQRILRSRSRSAPAKPSWSHAGAAGRGPRHGDGVELPSSASPWTTAAPAPSGVPRDRGGRGRRGHRLAAAVHRGGCGGRRVLLAGRRRSRRKRHTRQVRARTPVTHEPSAAQEQINPGQDRASPVPSGRFDGTHWASVVSVHGLRVDDHQPL